MAFYCFTCKSIYGSRVEHLPRSTSQPKLIVCPTKGCSSPLIEIDDGILPIILVLNEKGYDTHTSCSGHMYDGRPEIILGMFDDDIIKDSIESHLDSLPKDFTYEPTPKGKPIYITKRWDIYKNRDTNERLKLKIELQNSLARLGEWVLSLPDISE